MREKPGLDPGRKRADKACERRVPDKNINKQTKFHEMWVKVNRRSPLAGPKSSQDPAFREICAICGLILRSLRLLL